jgi:hypothetical protein
MKPVALASICACLLFAGAAAAVEVPATYGDAMRWYKRAAEGGSANAQFFLGRMYETGQSRKRDPAAAVTWYRKAADQGHRLAAYRLGQMYLTGTGVGQSYTIAAKWFEMAARQGLHEAQYNLGYLYDRGFGVDRNPRVAATWYRKAALSGLGPAQYNLGVLLAGAGGAGGAAADLIEAWVWLSLAAEGGVEAAAAARAGVAKRMSESELGQARRRLDAQKSAMGKKR